MISLFHALIFNLNFRVIFGVQVLNLSISLLIFSFCELINNSFNYVYIDFILEIYFWTRYLHKIFVLFLKLVKYFFEICIKEFESVSARLKGKLFFMVRFFNLKIFRKKNQRILILICQKNYTICAVILKYRNTRKNIFNSYKFIERCLYTRN